MCKPKRIQRLRKKGWITPPGSVYVGRPTKWGNPFKFDEGGDTIYGDISFRRAGVAPWAFIEYCASDKIRDRVIELHKLWLAGHNPWDITPCPVTTEEIKSELAGKVLTCWCPTDKKCHADALLEIANS